jgi:hypothetical protein
MVLKGGISILLLLAATAQGRPVRCQVFFDDAWDNSVKIQHAIDFDHKQKGYLRGTTPQYTVRSYDALIENFLDQKPEAGGITDAFSNVWAQVASVASMKPDDPDAWALYNLWEVTRQRLCNGELADTIAIAPLKARYVKAMRDNFSATAKLCLRRPL